MTQENPNPQTPSTPEQDFSESTPEKELLEKELKKQPLWKRQIIKTLQGTISVLETTIVKLEDTSVESATDKSNLLNQLLDKFQLVWRNFLNTIRKLLPKKLTAKLSNNGLTGIIFGIIIALILVVPNIFTSQAKQTISVEAQTDLNDISEKVQTPEIISQETPPEISQETPPETILEKTPPEDTEVLSKDEIQEAEIQEITPIKEKQEANQDSSIEKPEENPQSTEIITETEIKPEAEVKAEVKVEEQRKTLPLLELPSPKTEVKEKEEKEKIESEIISEEILSEEALEEPVTTTETIATQTTQQLTPEQILIASIQNQLADISKDNSVSDVIKSVQANFGNSTLTLIINNEWYSLKEREQNKLGTKILQRSQELDFRHTEIIDTQGKLVARNPVVGNEIIIFAR
ncbi:MAG: hypothetical protein ACFB02_06145 [Mastigocoleus sp.]